MGHRELCGERAGWLQSWHPACETRAGILKKELYDLVSNGTSVGETFSKLNADVEELATQNNLPSDRFKETILEAANDAAAKAARESPVSEDEFKRLVGILQGFGIDGYTSQFADRRWYGMAYLGMSYALWQVLHGEAPFYDPAGRMQFNLHHDEIPIFSSGAVTYAEERTWNAGRAYSGLSMPVGGGIYYHNGGSHGHTVSGLSAIDTGETLISSRALYFGGQRKTLRIPLDRVVRYQPYIDAVGICESHGAPKVFNLLSALSARLV